MPHNRGFGRRALTGTSVAPPDGKVEELPLGVYHGPAEVTQCLAFETEAGPLPWRLDFGDEAKMFATKPAGASSSRRVAGSMAASSVDTYPIASWAGSGRKLLLGLPMIPRCVPGHGAAGFSDVAAGAYDAVFEAVAAALAANGFGASNAMIRIGWEFNGDWFAWSAKGMAAKFVAAFRRIVTVMRSIVPGLATMWNPARGDSGIGRLESYWPGAEYVTCAALDVYDTEWRTGAILEPEEFDHIRTQRYGLDWLADFARIEGADVGLGEWGLCPRAKLGTESEQGGGDDPTFVRDMMGWIKGHAIGPCILWNDKGEFAANPKAMAALKESLA